MNKLSILIPTYNRIQFLEKNIYELVSIIRECKFESEVEIIISNNCSDDNTSEVLTKICKDKATNISIQVYNQETNIGLQKNALFVLEKAKSEFCMYLGDDDFISKEYLQEIVEEISVNNSLACVLPSFKSIDIEGNVIEGGRDLKRGNTRFEKGFTNCYINSWRGHQLSGVVFKTAGTLNSFLNQEVNNIYLFIYFVAFNCLRGDTYHLTQYPVKITQPGQEKKDWGYGDDGLINEVFDNYKKLKVSYARRLLLELRFLDVQFVRVLMYKKYGIKKVLKILLNIDACKNATVLFSFIFPFQLVYLFFKDFLKKRLAK